MRPIARRPVRSPGRLDFAVAVGGLLLIGVTSTARAATAGSFSLVSNETLRGRSISAGRPVGRGGLTYDDASGIYGGVSLSAVAARSEGVRFFDAQEYAGFAKRISPRLTLDLGVLNVDYGRYASVGTGGYTEAYAGLIGHRLSGHLHLSPNYFGSGVATVYATVDDALFVRGAWSVNGHAGLFFWVAGGRPVGAPAVHYDWALAINRAVGPMRLHVGWVQGGPNRDFYAGRERPRGAAVAGVTIGL